MLERRVRMGKRETLGQLERPALLGVKAMWGKRVTQAHLVPLGLQDPEEHRERTDPKATSALLDFLEMQDLLEKLASME